MIPTEVDSRSDWGKSSSFIMSYLQNVDLIALIKPKLLVDYFIRQLPIAGMTIYN